MFLDFIKIDTTFPLIRIENDLNLNLFSSGSLYQVLKMEQTFLPLIQALTFSSWGLLRVLSVVPSFLPITAFTMWCNDTVFLSCHCPDISCVWEASGHPPSWITLQWVRKHSTIPGMQLCIKRLLNNPTWKQGQDVFLRAGGHVYSQHWAYWDFQVTRILGLLALS